MSGAGPDEVGATRALSDAVLKRLAWLDLSNVQRRFVAGAGVSLAAIWNLSVEYRRFLLLRMTHPELDIPAPPLIDSYWRLHAADQEKFAADCDSLAQGTDLSPDEFDPPPRLSERTAGPEVQELYKTTFPCGNAELWGWPQLTPGPRISAPTLGSVRSRLPSAIDESTRARLREEAFEQRILTEPHSTHTSVDRGRGNGPVLLYCADRSPVLHEVHWTGTVPQLIAEQTGVIVCRRAAGYLYYRCGNLARIHTDQYGDDLVLLTLLSGSVEPLHCHLHLVDMPLEEIKNQRETANGLPEGGTPFDINAVPFLLSGQRIPHQREPRERQSATIVAVQWYGPLLPLRAAAFDQRSETNLDTDTELVR